MATSATIRELITQKVGGSSQEVQEKVVQLFVDEEVNRRVGLVQRAVPLVEAAQADLAKIQPDQAQFDGNGAELSKTWSKGQLDKRRKAEERLKRLDDALDKALTAGDFNELEKQLKQQQGGGNANSAKPESES